MEEEISIFENVQQDVSTLPRAAELGFEALENRYFKVLIINNALLFLVGLIGLIFLWFNDDEGLITPYFQWILLGYLVIYLVNLLFVTKGFKFRSYAFRSRDITYRSGWLWRSSTTVPFNRVQHCELSQGILDRYFGLAKIKIFTAGGSSSDVSIPGIELDQATDLKQYILTKIQSDE